MAAGRNGLIGLFSSNALYYEEAIRAAMAGVAPVAMLASEAELVALRDELEVLISAVYPSAAGRPARLRLMQATGAGLDRIDRSLMPDGCTLCATPGHEIPMAEYILACMLRFALDMPRLSAEFGQASKQGGAYGNNDFHGELFGRTACLVGFGLVGSETAKRLGAMGMRVLAVTRSPVRSPDVSGWFPPQRLAEAVAEADFVVLTCPLTPETAGLFDARLIGRMRRNAVLINVARAQIVDEDALYEALVGHRIGGAALDVWYLPPPAGAGRWQASNRDFRSLANVVATPHASAWTSALWDRRRHFVIANLQAYFAGAPLRGVIAP